MPTYELILLARMNSLKATQLLLKGVANATLKSGGINVSRNLTKYHRVRR